MRAYASTLARERTFAARACLGSCSPVLKGTRATAGARKGGRTRALERPLLQARIAPSCLATCRNARPSGGVHPCDTAGHAVFLGRRTRRGFRRLRETSRRYKAEATLA
eukprot:4658183-Pleurochrysis_carterae.AAC.2